MVSGSLLHLAETRTITARPRQLLRLTVKPDAFGGAMLDGGWWPRSRDPLAEFPALIAGMTVRLSPVAALEFAGDAWSEAPRQIAVAGHLVRLDGFRAQRPNTVLVSGRGWYRVLLVIPPETPETEAEAALASAAIGLDPAFSGKNR